MKHPSPRAVAVLILVGATAQCNSTPTDPSNTQDPPYSNLSTDTRVALSGRPYSVAVASTGAVYVAVLDASTLARTNLPTFAFDTAAKVGSVPTEVAFNSTGTTAYVTNQGDQNVGVVDVASNTQTTTVPVAGNPFAVIVAPGDSIVYVTTTADSLFGIRTASNTIARRLYMPRISNGLAIHGSLLYVSTRDAGTVTEVDMTTNTVVRTLQVGGSPQGIVVSPDGAKLYIANQNGTLQFWDLTANSGTAVPLAGPGYGLALCPADGRLYATTLGSYPVSGGGEVQVFDPTTHSLVTSYLLGGWARRIAFNTTGTVAVVANDNGGWVDFLH